MKKTEEKPWKVEGGMPSVEARVRACLVLLGRPPIIRPDVLEEIRLKEAEREAQRPKLKTA